MEKSDNTLIQQIKDGEAEVFAELVQRYNRPVYNLMFRFCRSHEEAGELTQEVFCRAYEKLADFGGDKFFSWLYTLAFNYGRDWQRNTRRNIRKRAAYQQNANVEQPLFPEEIAERNEEISRVNRALTELSHESREILLLRFKRELSIREIAAIFSLSESGVKMRIHRALPVLQHILNREKDGYE